MGRDGKKRILPRASLQGRMAVEREKIKEDPELKVMHDRRLVPRADVGRDVRCGEDSGWDFSRFSIEFHTPRPMWEDRMGAKNGEFSTQGPRWIWCVGIVMTLVRTITDAIKPAGFLIPLAPGTGLNGSVDARINSLVDLSIFLCSQVPLQNSQVGQPDLVNDSYLIKSGSMQPPRLSQRTVLGLSVSVMLNEK